MTPGELIPQTPTEPPEYGVPPAGFDSWEEYLLHKCKAAHAIYDTVYGLFGALSFLPILQITVTVVGTALGGYVAGTAFGAAAFPPAAIVAIAALAVAIGLLDAQAFIQFRNIQAYLASREDAIVCALYQSGSASEALEGLAAEVEDAIQSIAWSSIFGGVVGPQLAVAVGSLAGEAETNNLINPLFQVTEDFAYPDVDCSSCGGEPPLAWHFDSDEELWEFSVIENEGDYVIGSWVTGVTEPDPLDSSAGQLQCLVDKPSPPVLGTYGIWTYEYPYGDVPEVVEGDSFKVDLYCSRQQAAEFVVRVNYTDATYSQTYVPNPSGWSERVVAATTGKFVASLAVWFGVGEDAELHSFRMDRARWGQ
jgi:hypothetical protein